MAVLSFLITGMVSVACAADMYHIILENGGKVCTEDYYEEASMLYYQKYGTYIGIAASQVREIQRVQEDPEIETVEGLKPKETEAEPGSSADSKNSAGSPDKDSLTSAERMELRNQLSKARQELERIQAIDASVYRAEATQATVSSHGSRYVTAEQIKEAMVQKAKGRVRALERKLQGSRGK